MPTRKTVRTWDVLIENSFLRAKRKVRILADSEMDAGHIAAQISVTDAHYTTIKRAKKFDRRRHVAYTLGLSGEIVPVVIEGRAAK